jgi:hypothetical protein
MEKSVFNWERGASAFLNDVGRGREGLWLWRAGNCTKIRTWLQSTPHTTAGHRATTKRCCCQFGDFYIATGPQVVYIVLMYLLM